MTNNITLEAEITPGMPVNQVIELARLAEDVGFDRLGISDVVFWHDCFMLLGLVAQSTTRIELGPMVTNPYSRHPAVLAGIAATLHDVSNGRAFMGLGVGAGLEAVGETYARPVAHVPEVHVEPFPDEEDLGGHGGHVVPADEADEGQVELGKGVHPRHAAQGAGHFPGSEHPRIGRGDTGQLQRQVRLHGGVHLGRTVGVNVPSAVRELFLEDVVDCLTLPVGIDFAPPVVEGHHVGDQGHIDHQLAHPVPLRLLL